MAEIAREWALTDIGVGVRWLRDQAGVDSVVLLGNSGGASLMAGYQARSTELDVPRGDLFISLNAHPGRPDMLTAWLDPSVVDEGDPLSVDPSLDMFNGENGPPYQPGFVDRYRQAQVARNERITQWPPASWSVYAPGEGWTGSSRCFGPGPTCASPTSASTRPSAGPAAMQAIRGPPTTAARGLAAANTLRSWLSMWSLITSGCRAAPHLARITEPALVVQSTGDQGWFPSDAQTIFKGLASADKRLEWLAGDHYLLDPPNSRATVATLIAGWLADHGSA